MSNRAVMIVIFAIFATFLGVNAMSTESTIEIRIGETGADFSKRNSSLMEVDHHPAGLNFYEMTFLAANRRRINIKFSDRVLPIENVLSIMGTEDTELAAEGLSQFDINSALTESDLISHNEARMKFFATLQNIERAGWKATIPLGTARLKGKEMTRLLLNTDRYTTLDPSYIPTLDEWMKMPSRTSWEYYYDHMYLTVSFTREHTLTDPTKLGAYLVNFNLRNESEEFRSHVSASDRKKWKEVLPATLRKLAENRTKMERELRSQGIAIDNTYVDPPAPEQAR